MQVSDFMIKKIKKELRGKAKTSHMALKKAIWINSLPSLNPAQNRSSKLQPCREV